MSDDGVFGAYVRRTGAEERSRVRTSGRDICASIWRKTSASVRRRTFAIERAACAPHCATPMPLRKLANIPHGRRAGSRPTSLPILKRARRPGRGYPDAANASAGGCVRRRRRRGGAKRARRWWTKTGARWRCEARSESRIPASRRAGKPHVLPSIRRQHFVQASESEKFSAVEERRAAGGENGHQRLHRRGRRGNKESRVHAQKAATECASLSSAAQNAGDKVVGIAACRENLRIAEVRG